MRRIYWLLITILIIISLSGCGEDSAVRSVEPKEKTVSNKQYTVQYGSDMINGLYSGNTIDGVPSGYGSFISDSNNLSYEGNWDNGGFAGEGHLEYSNYLIVFEDGFKRYGKYSGDVIDGIASGEGSFSAVTDDNIEYEYTGEWKHGLWDGMGSRIFENNAYCPEVGHFSHGEFTPTVFEYYTAVSNENDAGFTMEEYAASFLKDNAAVFKTNKPGELSINPKFSYKKYTKDASSYNQGLMQVKDLIVRQIIVNTVYNEKHTLCILTNKSYSNVYYALFYGDCPNIYEGNKVKLVALPLTYFTYKTTANDYIWAIACAGVVMKK